MPKKLCSVNTTGSATDQFTALKIINYFNTVELAQED
jgi:hypothetical protein